MQDLVPTNSQLDQPTVGNYTINVPAKSKTPKGHQKPRINPTQVTQQDAPSIRTSHRQRTPSRPSVVVNVFAPASSPNQHQSFRSRRKENLLSPKRAYRGSGARTVVVDRCGGGWRWMKHSTKETTNEANPYRHRGSIYPNV